MPASASSATFCRSVVSSRGWLPGRSTSMGWRSKVIAAGGSPRVAASSTTRSSSTRWPRCTPSNIPMVTTVASRSGGTWLSPRNDHGGSGGLKSEAPATASDDPGQPSGRPPVYKMPSLQHDPGAGAAGGVLDDCDQAAVRGDRRDRLAKPGGVEGLAGGQRGGFLVGERPHCGGAASHGGGR